MSACYNNSMSNLFSAVITEEDDMFVVTNPETGVTSQGASLDEAVPNLKEALELYFEEAGVSKKTAMSLPKQSCRNMALLCHDSAVPTSCWLSKTVLPNSSP